MAIDRPTTISADGLDAVRLWFQWRQGDTIAWDALLTYNRADTENLVPLVDRFYANLMFRFGPSSFSTTLQPAFCQ